MLRPFAAFLLLIAVAVSPLLAQSDSYRAQKSGMPESRFQLPADPMMWINSEPLSVDSLEGKGAFLWFYEEGCPRCEGKWPSLLEMSRQYEGEPVVFIAVNSGNSRREVESYVRENNISWPVVADTHRLVEQSAGGFTISLNNIAQAMYLTPEGELRQGRWADPERTIKQALKGAAWRVDPEIVPDALRLAWRDVELGNFVRAAPTLRRYGKRGDAETRKAADALNAAVKAEMEEDLDEARAAAKAGDRWTAYQKLETTSLRFKGFDMPESVKTGLAKLKKDPAVRTEAKLQRKLMAAKRGLATPNPRAMKRAVGVLKKLIEEAPDSAAAEEAQTLLARTGGQ